MVKQTDQASADSQGYKDSYCVTDRGNNSNHTHTFRTLNVCLCLQGEPQRAVLKGPWDPATGHATVFSTKHTHISQSTERTHDYP